VTVPILTEIKSISAAGYEGDRCDGAGLDNYREQVCSGSVGNGEGVPPLSYWRERMKKQRKQYAPEEKVAILRRHLLEKEPISKLCDEVGLQPTVFYRWQKEFFENGTAAFEQKRPTNHSADQERIAYLEKKIQTKDEVLAELMAEHVALKKDIGEL
jgi:transposase-like protein